MVASIEDFLSKQQVTYPNRKGAGILSHLALPFISCAACSDEVSVLGSPISSVVKGEMGKIISHSVLTLLPSHTRDI